jgi:hypothetical protein
MRTKLGVTGSATIAGTVLAASLTAVDATKGTSLADCEEPWPTMYNRDHYPYDEFQFHEHDIASSLLVPPEISHEWIDEWSVTGVQHQMYAEGHVPDPDHDEC